jgi:hypothetical protein
MSAARLLALAAVLAAPLAAGALEPRFDHRDTHGPFADVLAGHDTVAISGRSTSQAWRPVLRPGYGFAVSDEGSELLLGAQLSLRSWDDPGKERVLAAADLRYRSYFGTEELKTFFEIGIYTPLRSRLEVGPIVGLGVIYDFSRTFGLYANGDFGTAFGDARTVTFLVGAGAQLRFELL